MSMGTNVTPKALSIASHYMNKLFTMSAPITPKKNGRGISGTITNDVFLLRRNGGIHLISKVFLTHAHLFSITKGILTGAGWIYLETILHRGTPVLRTTTDL